MDSDFPMTFFSLKTDVNVPTEINKKNKKTNQKKLIFIGVLEATDEKSRINQVYGSKDPDPDPYQNVTDPEHFSYHCECAVTKKFRL